MGWRWEYWSVGAFLADVTIEEDKFCVTVFPHLTAALLMAESMQPLQPWHNDHSFGQDRKRPGEARTLLVLCITILMMVAEIAAGIAFGSMALLADGLHMASHAVALGIALFAYVYARRHAHDEGFSFGTGKVNSLGGFTGAVLLGVFAAIMLWESGERLWAPTEIQFDLALQVAVLGLVVNGASVFLLAPRPSKSCAHGDSLTHGVCQHSSDNHDHNLQAAYFHVMADALTSVLAIGALLAGLFYGLVWLDPLMGIVGALLIARWSLGLIRSTSRVLLDRQGPAALRTSIRECIEAVDATQVVDLHVWSIGTQIFAAEIVVLANDPRPPYEYKRLLPTELGLVHVMIEAHRQGDPAIVDMPDANGSRDSSQLAS